MSEFYSKPTEYAKDNGDIRIDFNYNSLVTAKGHPKDPILIQQTNTWSDETDMVELSLDKAKWLSEQLQSFIKILEE